MVCLILFAYKDWEEYISGFKAFLRATKRVKGHNNPEIAGMPCEGCKDTKSLLILAGGTEVKMLFNHEGKVVEADSWEEVLDKISRGIAGQAN